MTDAENFDRLLCNETRRGGRLHAGSGLFAAYLLYTGFVGAVSLMMTIVVFIFSRYKKSHGSGMTIVK